MWLLLAALQCSVYFDKTQLILRDRIIEFEDGGIDGKLLEKLGKGK